MTPRQRAIEECLAILRQRERECEQTRADWEQRYPDDKLGQATERAARDELRLCIGRIEEDVLGRFPSRAKARRPS